ncbi:hypothetical protein DSO57_1036264 [Entomophthora muscae]|uniref:Uncharacterized protein n=1 Tax=Entomophthora muscae TaxID=34485 RepID=A0ACC2U8B5_9FUNG|nr:hypothetical protein DSO57_1036264 [Entomophthora muscae]
MAGLSAEVEDLQVSVATSVDPPPHNEEDNCCPGKEGEPWIKCATLLAHLKQDINVTSQDNKALESNLQEMNELTKNIDEQFSPLLVQVQELPTKIAGVCATAEVQQIQIDDTLQVSITSRNSLFQQAITLNTLGESVHQLWTM